MTLRPNTTTLARAVASLASVWFAFTAGWGMFGIPGDGHLGAGGAGNVIAAEQIVRWKILYPAWDWFTGVAPSKGAYICHHPFGQYYIPAFFFWLFGHRDFNVHLPAVLMSMAMPPLLYGIGKARWGAPIGAVAAAAYAVVPIAVGFSSFLNLETVCIFGALLFFWGHSRHMATGARRHLIASLVGLVFACSGDWVGYIIVAPVLGWAFVRAFVLPAWATPRFRFLPYAKWWSFSATVAVLTLVYWVGLFHHADQIKDWLAAGGMRSSGAEAPLRTVLSSRKAWLYFSFTPLGIWLGVAALPVCVLRFFVTRWDEETYAPALLLGAVIQYVKFKEGADVHIFWAHYFAPYLALAIAQLAGAIASTLGWVVGLFSRSRAPLVVAVAGLVFGLLPVIAMAPDGVRSLWVWRRTGGRYDDSGNLIYSHIDTLQVIQDVVLPRTPRGSSIDVHPSVQWYWHHQWKFQGIANPAAMPVAGGSAVATHPFFLARANYLSSDEEKRIAATAHLRVYGPTWVVDQREPPAPLDAYSMNERQPTPFHWLFYGGTEPTRTMGSAPDPWLTWELRTHLGQAAAVPPGEPATLDEARIAHNVAIAGGDTATAERWREHILARLDRSVATEFDRGVKLLGARVTGGVEPRVETWFECVGPMGDAAYNVHSKIEARAAFSLIPPNPIGREMALGPLIATKLWRAGMIYETHAVLNHLIGHERYWGYWASRDGVPAPRPLSGQLETNLVTLP